MTPTRAGAKKQELCKGAFVCAKTLARGSSFFLSSYLSLLRKTRPIAATVAGSATTRRAIKSLNVVDGDKLHTQVADSHQDPVERGRACRTARSRHRVCVARAILQTVLSSSRSDDPLRGSRPSRKPSDQTSFAVDSFDLGCVSNVGAWIGAEQHEIGLLARFY